MTRRPSRLAVIAMILPSCLSLVPAGCSDRQPPSAGVERRIDNFRVIKFAGEKVVVPFRGGLQAAPIVGPDAGYVPKAGDRVILSDVGDGEVFLAQNLDALKFYHSSPGPDQLGRFRSLGDEGDLFVVARGTVGSVKQVVDGELPQGLKAVELQLPGEKGGPAWVSDTFVRRAGDDPR
jgi:hypothetical protein